MYILAYFIHKKQSFKHLFFWALSVGQRGWTPKFSNPRPKDMQLKVFTRLSTAILTKDFNHALPTSNVTPTPTPCSDTNRRLTYLRIFSCLSTSILSILTKYFTQALPTFNVTLRQHHVRIPLVALRTLGFVPASLPPF